MSAATTLAPCAGSGDLADRIADAFCNEYGALREGEFLRKGACPNCGKKELWTSADYPWVIRCGRLNKCGFEATAKELFPEFYRDFSKRIAATTQYPTATADAWLRDVRGLNPDRFKGWYSQGQFWHPKGDKGSATVRFALPNGAWFERLIDEVTITQDDGEKDTRKANFHGPHKGQWWQPPGFAPADGETVYIVEGILDALALIQIGQNAVAVLSCVNYPDVALDTLPNAHHVQWVWALDDDEAGKKYIKRHVQRMQKAGYHCAAVIPPTRNHSGDDTHKNQNGRHKRDWNDLVAHEILTEQTREAVLLDARYRGHLLLAANAHIKGALIFDKTRRLAFVFAYQNSLWWFETKTAKQLEQSMADMQDVKDPLERAEGIAQMHPAHCIADCLPEPLYHEESNINDEFNRYYFRVSLPNGNVGNCAFTGAQISAASEFKKRLLHARNGAMWLGNNKQLDNYLRKTIRNLPSVTVFDAAGYSKRHGCYVFPSHGVKDGKLVAVNNEDFIEFGPKLAIKTGASVDFELNDHIEEPNWLNWIVEAYGPKGVVVLAYWIGCLFAEQIRGMHKSWPFLEFVGEPASGKTTLLEYLWKLFGRTDEEGFDPRKSSLAARTRTFAQYSNLPVVLIEADRGDDDSARFNWGEMKTAYNGRPVRSRGVKTGGNEVYEPRFRGGLVISQNARVDSEEAILQRIVSVELTRQNHTTGTAEIAQRLEGVAAEKVSGVLVTTLLNEKPILKTFRSAYAQHKRRLTDAGIKIDRLALNHAQIAAFVDVLRAFHGLDDAAYHATQHLIVESAKERQALVANDTPALIEFWDVFDYLNQHDKLDHSEDADYIAINLNQIAEKAREAGQTLPPLRDLKRLLHGSRRHKYTVQKVLWSGKGSPSDYDKRQLRCWIFKK